MKVGEREFTGLEIAAFFLTIVASMLSRWVIVTAIAPVVLLVLVALRARPNWSAAFRSVLSSTFVVAILSAGGVAIGIVASIWPDQLKTSPPVTWILELPHLPTAYASTIFWGALAVWGILFYAHTNVVRGRESEASKQLERLVIRAPHRGVFAEASKCVRVAMGGLRAARLAPEADRSVQATGAIREVLQEIARFAKAFGGRTDAKYGANIMIALSVAEVQAQPKFRERLRFFNPEEEVLASLRAVLFMDERFLVSDVDGAAHASVNARPIPLICLPVPQATHNKDGRWIALPGAPMTFLDEHPNIHQNLTDFVRDCREFGDFRPSTVDSVAKYFKSDGGAIQSFASYKIGGTAVLNIDCSETRLLGEEMDFITTFSALLLPTQLLLAELVDLVYVRQPNERENTRSSANPSVA